LCHVCLDVDNWRRVSFMKISININQLYASQQAQSSTASRTKTTSFSSELTAATAETSTVKQADFTSMTRQELIDWMNGQIRSGKMSLDESSPFLLMTMKMPVAAGQLSVDMATDTTRINFIEKARSGIEGALSRHDQNLADRLEMAIELMHKGQGSRIGVNETA
jgi:anti-sigma28 factor (negative regulator of flagellin synthesis)